MNKNRIPVQVIKTTLVLLICLLLPFQVLAAAWDAYAKYIPDYTPVTKSQLRGAWISTVVNLDWPSSKTKAITDSSLRIQKSKEELIILLDKAVSLNMNAVFLQVRSTSDALYKSELVPWSRYLTGTFGKDPGFDPLQFAIEEAHKRNLELHAWFNPYRVSMDTSEATKSSLNISKSVYKEHPDWIRTASSRFVIDPGIPDARKWVEDCVMEVVNKYDIDGVHFDDYFYYEAVTNEMGDDATFQKYNNGQFAKKADWRRNNTYLLVKELSSKIRAAKPWVKFGVSPSAIWRNKKDDPAGSDTNSSYTNYDKCYADTRKWVNEELIDYICPQIYFTYANPAAPYGVLADWWAKTVRNKKVHLYIGQALYRVNEGSTSSDKDFSIENGVPEMSRQIKLNTVHPDIKGSVMFRMNNFFESPRQAAVAALQTDLWSSRALVPVMPWKGGRAPGIPAGGAIGSNPAGIKLTWTDNDTATAYFAIYRYSSSETPDITSDESSKRLIATVRKTASGIQQFTDTSGISMNGVTYVVSSLDRLHNQSKGLIINNKSRYFNDVGQNVYWAIEAIDRLYEKGVVAGAGQNAFLPMSNTKRGDFLLMLTKALELKGEAGNNFTDVPLDSYYYNAIGAAKSLGITAGTGNGKFEPKANISRQDMLVQVYKGVQAAGISLAPASGSELGKFTDASQVSSYAREALAVMVKNGIVSGSGSKLNPRVMATRAEIAVVLSKLK
ncbi:endo-1,4-beta-xylanase A precursor [Ruminiclostridium hungatei]|uniref:Endo-1,4-beta-xylanase A n=1 Tax=Ruminiclostridium hungatei TaxID=48256 RepID=A0A1V4SLC0_RUMHU|nr:family 10 glycosylhydrolase [Ruminiclostridium hungatei]OPX44021.1 endo-1,4-beta-xylanase A precursor [Ruminiclostridium hungatei]